MERKNQKAKLRDNKICRLYASMIKKYNDRINRLEGIVAEQNTLLVAYSERFDKIASSLSDMGHIVNNPAPDQKKYKCSDKTCPMRPLDGYCERNCEAKQ